MRLQTTARERGREREEGKRKIDLSLTQDSGGTCFDPILRSLQTRCDGVDDCDGMREAGGAAAAAGAEESASRTQPRAVEDKRRGNSSSFTAAASLVHPYSREHMKCS